MINCILIDDEPFARETLEEYIRRIPSLNLLGRFENPLDASEFIDDDIDLIFSDIQMPEMDGISFLKTLNNPPEVIFITGHPHFAVKGFELNVLDYLLKPYSFDRFLMAVNKAKKALKNSQTALPKKNHLTIPVGYQNVLVQFHEIKYIKGMEDYVRVETADKGFTVKETMNHMEAILPPNFIRIQKSYIVNINCVHSVGANEVTLKGDSDKLPIGLKYREDFYLKIGVQK